ncbi:MAG TPA: carboxynorspermidine decarboxylase [Methylococcaceae bacterium]|nr:carboxynorspermidine decarboxylase [Methylococcaceae bacterium]
MPPIQELPPATPAFVYDESRILETARLLHRARTASGCRILYSIKSFPFESVLGLLEPWVDGFSVSSLFEARLAATIGDGGRSLHISTPGLRREEMSEIGSLCGFIGFNSLGQFRRFLPFLRNGSSAGLRINPKLSFLDDRRYDPCREFSKLGVPLEELERVLAKGDFPGNRLRGLHFHNVFSSRSFDPLQKTVARIEESLADWLPELEWLNLGGGYLFETEADLQGLCEVAGGLRRRWDLDVYFEPGKALVGQAGYLVASVIDLFENDGKLVAILDTAVNHHPETFEYQIRPEPAWDEPGEGQVAILAGCTCLAGDVFGEYRFERPLVLGDRVAFQNVGAYSLIKANRFNGYNLPAIYAWDGRDGLRLMKSYDYEGYASQWTADAEAPLDYHSRNVRDYPKP